VASLLDFYQDVRLSLRALRLELGRHWPGDED
jgi:hypothetical protein